MAQIISFFTDVVGAGAVCAALLAMAGYFGRTQLAHWLNRDIERMKRDFLIQIEAEKAIHQRQLEDYRVSLIGTVERAKAEQMVATAAALKFSEYRFTAISALNQAIANMGLNAYELRQMHMNKIYRSDSYDDWVARHADTFKARVKELREALPAAAIFMRQPDVEALQAFQDMVEGIPKLGELEFLELIGQDVERIYTAEMENFVSLREEPARKAHVVSKQKEVDELLRTTALALLNMHPTSAQ